MSCSGCERLFSIALRSFVEYKRVPNPARIGFARLSNAIRHPRTLASMTPPPKRALIAITSATAPLHEGHPTGVFIEEALHPFNVFKAAGFEVDIASEKGTYAADWLSLQPAFLPDEDKKQYEDMSGEFRKKLDSGTTPDKLNADDVSATVVYFQRFTALF